MAFGPMCAAVLGVLTGLIDASSLTIEEGSWICPSLSGRAPGVVGVSGKGRIGSLTVDCPVGSGPAPTSAGGFSVETT